MLVVADVLASCWIWDSSCFPPAPMQSLPSAPVNFGTGTGAVQGGECQLLYVTHAVKARSDGRQTQVPVCLCGLQFVLASSSLSCLSCFWPGWPTATSCPPPRQQSQGLSLDIHRLPQLWEVQTLPKSLILYHSSLFYLPHWTLTCLVQPDPMNLSGEKGLGIFFITLEKVKPRDCLLWKYLQSYQQIYGSFYCWNADKSL